MAQPSEKILEGVFAVNKPPSISSAQVLRFLQYRFEKSKTFAPLLEQTNEAKRLQRQRQPKRRKKDNDPIFKMGHGGTLDPMATGVLIVGIGRGTKFLHDFLGCKKTYETVVLFGKSTDTYDVAGKVVAEAPTDRITKSMLEDKIKSFQGKLQQTPPMFSAIKVDGMKLYDYARTGKELPRELKSREIEMFECSLLDYYAPGEHDYRWPAAQVPEEEKAVVMKLITGTDSATQQSPEQQRTSDISTSRGEADKHDKNDIQEPDDLPENEKAALHTHHLPEQEESPANAPAARLRLTVSSGFYVRSFAYDLGIACGSYGTMAALVRSHQKDFTTIEPAPSDFTPAVNWEDFKAGEEAWGPKITSVLEKWVEEHPPVSNQPKMDDRDGPDKDHRYNRSKDTPRRGSGSKRTWDNRDSGRDPYPRRRNSSSPEA